MKKKKTMPKSINRAAPFIKTDSFATSTVTHLGELVYTYKTITPCTII
jgi:hypothetical protein